MEEKITLKMTQGEYRSMREIIRLKICLTCDDDCTGCIFSSRKLNGYVYYESKDK